MCIKKTQIIENDLLLEFQRTKLNVNSAKYIDRVHILNIDLLRNQNISSLIVRLHGEYKTNLALWKHHVNLLLQSFRSVGLDLHQCIIEISAIDYFQ